MKWIDWKKFMRHLQPYKCITTMLLFLLLAACAAPAAQGEPTESIPPTVGTKSTPTPIPNRQAEAVLDESYERYIAHLAENRDLIPPEGLQDAIAQQPSMLLDVRQPLEVRNNGFIPGAVVIPMRELALKTSILPDFSVPIYTYCGDGRRCAVVEAGLGVFGWDVRCLEGGFDAWAAAGQPVEHGLPPYPEIDPLKPAFPCCGIYEVGPEYDELEKANTDAPSPALVAAVVDLFRNVPDDYGLLSPSDLKAAIQMNPALTILDVDLEAHAESDLSALPGYLHIPFGELMAQKDAWPSDQAAEIVVLAADDHSATLAQSLLWMYRYLNAKTIPGGWQTLAENSDL